MAERRGTRGLELWCRKITEGYPGVNVQNMTSSWRDGLGFCAIIHHFRPDLIDFSKLNKDDIYRNNELAFRIGEEYLGIPALLDAEDMVEYEIPDRLSIITYLAQFFQVFRDTQGSGARAASTTTTAKKQIASTTDRPKMVQQPSSSLPAKKITETVGRPRSEPCGKCGLPIFITERVNVGKHLFHRSCFVCARCNSQLTLSNYYETENDRQYCCETCPDEEKKRTTTMSTNAIAPLAIAEEEVDTPDVPRVADVPPLDNDDYSELFETALENDASLEKANSLTKNNEFTQAMSQFITSQLTTDGEDEAPALPQSKPPPILRRDRHVEDKSTDEREDSNESVGLPSPTSSFTNNSDKHSVERPNNVSSISNKTNRMLTANDAERDEEANDAVAVGDAAAPIVIDVEKRAVTKDETDTGTFPQASTPFVASKRQSVFANDDDGVDEKAISPIVSNVRQIDSDTKRSDSISNDETGKQLSDAIEVSSSDAVIEISSTDAAITIDDSAEERSDLRSGSIVEIKSDDEEPSPTKTHESTNPFDDEDYDEFEEDDPAEKATRTPSKLSRKESYPEELNPFDAEDEPATAPVPARRKRISVPKKLDSDVSEDGSCSGDSPIAPTMATDRRRMKIVQAPRMTLTPLWFEKDQAAESPDHKFSISRNSTPYSSNGSLPSTTGAKRPNYKKNRKAPPPPPSPLASKKEDAPYTDDKKNAEVEIQKENKEVINETKRGLNNGNPDKCSYLPQDKSTYGKWKKKKGPAPAKPIPIKRTVKKAISMSEIKHELEVVELQLQGLEKQGVRLEQTIRDRCGTEWAQSEDSPISADVDDMIVQLWDAMTEINELRRKQSELIYIQKQQRLEEEHFELEYEIRCLMMQPEAYKTDSDKAKEEELIVRLLKVVEKRNEIVECLEMDRLKEAAEDDNITSELSSLSINIEEKGHVSRLLHLKKNRKKEKKGKTPKIDMDKDVDESEVQKQVPQTDKKKAKKKKKFNLF